MKKKMLLVYNPCAGKGVVRSKLSYIVEAFVRANYELTIHATRGKDDATNVVAKIGSRFDMVTCCGGDGTLNEVTIGIMQCKKKPPCGYIPAGTTNDCAASLGLSKNLVSAAHTIIHGDIFPYDLGTINGNYFIYIAGFGAFTEVSYKTSQSVKNVLGRMAYLLAGVKSIPRIKKYRVRAEYEDKVIEDDFIYGMVSNSNSVGGFKGLNGKDVSLNDGLFEVTLIRVPHNPADLTSIINALLNPGANSRFVESFHTKKITLVSEEKLDWTVDGEYGGSFTEVEIENHMHAVNYVVNKEK